MKFCSLSAAHLAALDNSVHHAKRQAFAQGTSLNLRSQWRTYLTFCSYYGLDPLPASAADMCRYIIHLSHSLTTYQSIKNYLHGVTVLHKGYGVPCSFMSSFDVKLVLQSVKRNLLKAPNAKLPILPQMLLQFRRSLNLSKPLHATLWAAFLLAFFGFFRKANVVPPSPSRFDPASHLARGTVIRTDYGLSIQLSKTKTIQFHQRVLTIPISAIPNHPLDPVAAYHHMCSLIPAPAEAPAFVYPDSRGVLTTLTHATFQSNLRTLLRSIGLEPNHYSGHSFRRGGCSFAFQANVPSELIQQHGDWRSHAYRRYLSFPLSERLRVTSKMADLVTHSPYLNPF